MPPPAVMVTIDRPPLHSMGVYWAKADKGEITVSGMLKDYGIAIRYMMFKGDTVTPYYKPADHYIFHGGPWIR